MKSRYHTLDGMRGIAAIAVVMFHFGDTLGRYAPASGYLAVDLFFVLSGFVIAHSYDNKLCCNDIAGARISLAVFMRRRLVRLYPMYLVATLLPIPAILGATLLSRDSSVWTLHDLSVALPLAVLMLPAYGFGFLYPLNAPSWSLLFELLANFVYGAVRIPGGRILWAGTIAICAAGLAACVALTGHLNHGVGWEQPWWATLLWGAARVGYSFSLGMLICRARHVLPVPAVPTPMLAAFLVALLWAAPSPPWRGTYDLAFALAASPALVLLGSSTAPETRRRVALADTLGGLSYPIYLLHTPVENLLSGALRRMHISFATFWQPWSSLALVVALTAVAAAAGKLDYRAGHLLADWFGDHGRKPRPRIA